MPFAWLKIKGKPNQVPPGGAPIATLDLATGETSFTNVSFSQAEILNALNIPTSDPGVDDEVFWDGDKLVVSSGN